MLKMPFINRFSTTTNGAMTFTGNTLGLSKEANTNNAGTRHSIGAFISLNTALQVPTYPFPPGTTLNWQENSSQAILNIPPGSTVIYAELIWAGQYKTGSVDLSAFINNTIDFTTPSGTSSVSLDPATAFNLVVSSSKSWYVRSADVTSLVQADGAGAYSVGKVVGTVLNTDNSTNVAGWTLAVIYENSLLPFRNMTLFVGAEIITSSTGSKDVTISGFAAPSSGDVNGRILVSSSEGDANISGDQLLFGETVATLSNLSGPRNPINNFFASQINNDSGNLDTSGSFGNRNQNAITGQNIVAGRQGWDITNVDGSSQIVNGQTTAVVRFTTAGDAYSPNALGIQIDVAAPDIEVVKCVDKLIASYREFLTYTIIITNSGSVDANNIILTDLLSDGLMFFKGTFTINGIYEPNADPTNGVNIGDIPIDGTIIITYLVRVQPLLAPAEQTNKATLEFQFQSSPSGPIIIGNAESNEVVIFAQNGASTEENLNFLVSVVQNSANDFCNILLPNLIILPVSEIEDAIAILKSEFCSCKNSDILVAKAIRDIAKSNIKNDRCFF